ncbi:hypothetical protein Glove_21g196 [Diversispora epigaea]|uniref:Protein kinase domain-containing protein n=1 Tax=Diversispora epigaea TaxID=1348612 RepID=A0A397JLM2_9GLOM|nr:hypothetical protein Glove_21g196 [Diversispora epigaea]
MDFEFVDKSEFLENLNYDSDDYNDNDISNESESEVELLGDSDFVDSEDEISSKDFTNNDNYYHNLKLYGRCQCSHPFSSKGWCSPCKVKTYKKAQESLPGYQLMQNSLKENLIELQNKAHCPFCTLDCIEYLYDLKNVVKFDKNWKAEILLSKTGFSKIPGTDPKYVILKEIKDCLNEFSINNCVFKSANVLPYYGVTHNLLTDTDMIVMPYVPNGNLREYLKKSENYKYFNWWNKLALLSNLATILADLHDESVVHKNLHPNNILIGKYIDFPILSDTGLSLNRDDYSMNEKMSEQTDSQYIHGVLPYIDPTVFSSTFKFTKKSDVYSFAFIMYEIATFNLPFSDVSHDQDLIGKITIGLRPKIPGYVPIYYAELMRMCWDASPSARPDMRRLVNIFNYWRNFQINPTFHLTISPDSNNNDNNDSNNKNNDSNNNNNNNGSEEINTSKLFESFQKNKMVQKPHSERFLKCHSNAVYYSCRYGVLYENFVPVNKKKHKQKPNDNPIKKFIIPYEKPVKLNLYDLFTCYECEINQLSPSWWCNSCETSRLRDKFDSWTSGNDNVDQFIKYTQTLAPSCEGCLEWIPFSEFNVIRQIGLGGFSKVFHAIWKKGPMIRWNRNLQKYDRKENIEVALKQLKDSQNIKAEFFQELIAHLHCENNDFVIRCYGITQDPQTKEYIMVIDYAKNGDLRTFIHNQFNQITWNERLSFLQGIAYGLKKIHEEGLIHRDLHTGNILLEPRLKPESIAIGDLGMCRPATFTLKDNDGEIFGILPYIAPELFCGGSYSKKSDVYSFGTIMWEISSGALPFSNIPHDTELIKEIVNGVRPGLVYGTPDEYVELMWRCWDKDPDERPDINEIETILSSLTTESFSKGYRFEPFERSKEWWKGTLSYSILKNSKNSKNEENNENEESNNDKNDNYDESTDTEDAEWVIDSKAFYVSRRFNVTEIIKNMERLDLEDDEALIKETMAISLKEI